MSIWYTLKNGSLISLWANVRGMGTVCRKCFIGAHNGVGCKLTKRPGTEKSRIKALRTPNDVRRQSGTRARTYTHIYTNKHKYTN